MIPASECGWEGMPECLSREKAIFHIECMLDKYEFTLGSGINATLSRRRNLKSS